MDRARPRPAFGQRGCRGWWTSFGRHVEYLSHRGGVEDAVFSIRSNEVVGSLHDGERFGMADEQPVAAAQFDQEVAKGLAEMKGPEGRLEAIIGHRTVSFKKGRMAFTASCGISTSA